MFPILDTNLWPRLNFTTEMEGSKSKCNEIQILTLLQDHNKINMFGQVLVGTNPNRPYVFRLAC